MPDARDREVAGWLSRARADLRAADVDLAADPPLLADAVFHCQQAVEKAFKGLLTRHDHPFRQTHDLAELGVAALDHEPTLAPLVQESAPLTEYAWRFRYPGDLAEPERSEAEDALAVARRLVGEVESRCK